jgi:hypothetical protein
MAKKSAAKKKKAAKAPVRRAVAKGRSRSRAVTKSAAKAAVRKAGRARVVNKSRARASAAKAVATRARKVAVRKAVARKVIARKVVRKAAATARRGTKKTPRPVRRVAAAAVAVAKKAPPKQAAAPKKVAAVARPARKVPALDRERRTVGEPEMVPMPPSSLVPGHASSARSGADELRVKLATHTGAGPVLTAGDVDADWGAAEAVGDEAPGGDNPTPDQDVVDEIGRALGVEYDDDEELQGGDEIAGRDRDRWELDPASSDDFDER